MRDVSRIGSGWPGAGGPLLQSPACEQGEQSRSAAPRQRGAGLGADDQPPVGVSALPDHARGRRGAECVLAGARRAVPSQRRADPQGPRVLRRVRRPRRRLLRQGSAPALLPDSRPRSPACGSAIMGAGNLGLALADYAGFRGEGFEIAALFDTRPREDRPADRAAACRSTTSATSSGSPAAKGSPSR